MRTAFLFLTFFLAEAITGSSVTTSLSDESSRSTSVTITQVMDEKKARTCGTWKGKCPSKAVKKLDVIKKNCTDIQGGCNANTCCDRSTCQSAGRCPYGSVVNLKASSTCDSDANGKCPPSACCRKPGPSEKKRKVKVGLKMKRKASHIQGVRDLVKNISSTAVREAMAEVTGGTAAEWVRTCLVSAGGSISDADRKNTNVCLNTSSISTSTRFAFALEEKDVVMEFEVETVGDLTSDEISSIEGRVAADALSDSSTLANAGLEIDDVTRVVAESAGEDNASGPMSFSFLSLVFVFLAGYML